MTANELPEFDDLFCFPSPFSLGQLRSDTARQQLTAAWKIYRIAQQAGYTAETLKAAIENDKAIKICDAYDATIYFGEMHGVTIVSHHDVLPLKGPTLAEAVAQLTTTQGR